MIMGVSQKRKGLGRKKRLGGTDAVRCGVAGAGPGNIF